MPPNLRLSLTIFTLGFLIEAGVNAYDVITGSAGRRSEILFIVGAVASLLGILFLTLGRHEWNELHRNRVHHAHLTLLVTVLLALAAAGPVGYYAYIPSLAIPSWLAYEVGAAVAGSLFFSFILYAVIVYHLLGRAGQTIIVLALVAAIPVVGIVGYHIASDLATYLLTVRSSPSKLVALIEPIASYLSYMFLAYSLFAIAFLDAHRRVARGLEGVSADGTPPVVPPRPG
ncbi:MAG TPA: hypothetical protein VKT21_05945 [Thermoplasmata archaeon]|nr:hypothetical protein [Thermoplasmata archaeon]